MKTRKKRRLSLTSKKAIAGYCFITPFLLGLLFFFLYPLMQSIVFSFNRLEVSSDGYQLIQVGLENYHRAFFIHPKFRRILVESITQMLTDVPLIIIFSFFAANLLNQKFRGRALARGIFFLPVILTSGIIIAMENSDLMINMMRSSFQQEAQSGTAGEMLRSLELRNLLYQTRIDPRFINYITGAIDRIYQIVIASGVQILIFLAGLQSIPPSLFEASNIEGATGWENFWKITFPMVSPLILVCTVYTIIDSFTKPTNQVMTMIRDVAFQQTNYGFSAALAWIYFVLILVILGIVIGIISKRVFYHE